MKKIFITILMALLLIGMVNASVENDTDVRTKIVRISKEDCLKNGGVLETPMTCLYKSNMTRVPIQRTIADRINPFEKNESDDKFELEKDDVDEKSRVTGLENAMIRVKKNETREHLERVLYKINTKEKAHLEKFANLTFESEKNETVAHGKAKGRLLGFIPINKEYKYKVEVNGSITREKGFKDFFIRDSKEITGEN